MKKLVIASENKGKLKETQSNTDGLSQIFNAVNIKAVAVQVCV